MIPLLNITSGDVSVLRLELPDVQLTAGQNLPMAVERRWEEDDRRFVTLTFEGGKMELDFQPQRSGLGRLSVRFMAIRPLQLSRLGFRFRYLAQAPEAWGSCRESFHWLPNIKTSPNQFAGDHVFRAPAVILTQPDRPGVALVPDLELLACNRPVPHYLDMGFPESEPPWIGWGLADQRVTGHVYYEPTEELFDVPPQGLHLAAWIITAPSASFPGVATSFLWSQYGQFHVREVKPQTLPLRRYAEYGYPPALTHLWQPGPMAGTGGITTSTFQKADGTWRGRKFADDLWFQCWFNNARTAWGLAEWGRLLVKPAWVDYARQIMSLTLSAPRERGLFPAVYAPHDGGWKGSGSESGGTDFYHLPDAAWTGLWIRKYHQEIEPLPAAPERLQALADFLIDVQDADGGFPTFLHIGTLEPDPRLQGAACGALAIWFLGEELLAGAVPEDKVEAYQTTIARGVLHLRTHVLPQLRFEDFELYYSCSSKPLNFYDPWTHSFGINTLAIQWCAEAFRVAHLLGMSDKGEEIVNPEADLRAGQFCIDLLCLFQQVWSPPYLSFHAFGGFGVMNTDAEWNDARQAQFAETLANWYDLTGEDEYRERAIAASRASFALMVCEENREICPNNYQGTEQQFEVQGMMAENYGHDGSDSRAYQSGFHWGTGSALTTAARFIQRHIFPGPDTI